MPHHSGYGQDVIARVYRHYLTRGWDWANNLAAGGDAAARLRQDLDSGRLVLQLAEAEGAGRPLGFSVYPIGSAGGSVGFNEDRPDSPIEPSGTSFAAVQEARSTTGGIALDYRFDPTATFGIAVARYDASQDADRQGTSLEQDRSSDGLALYWQKDHSGFTTSTRFFFLEHAFADRSHDEILGQSGVSRHDGQSWSLDQRIARPMRAARATLIPWASLVYQQNELEAYTTSGLYTSDLHFSGTNVSDVLGAVGFDVRHDPIALAAGRQLWLSAGIAMTTSLHRDDAEVAIREAAVPDVMQRETIERDRLERFDLSLAAVLGLSEALNLRAGYAFAADQDNPRQQVRFNLDYRF